MKLLHWHLYFIQLYTCACINGKRLKDLVNPFISQQIIPETDIFDLNSSKQLWNENITRVHGFVTQHARSIDLAYPASFSPLTTFFPSARKILFFQ